MKDLFGNEIQPPHLIPKHGYKRKLYVRHYRRSEDKLKRCKNCRHLAYTWPGGRKYYKCKLVGITSSEATDIRLRNVCDLWDMNIETVGDFVTWLGTFLEIDPGQEQKIVGRLSDLLHPNTEDENGNRTT